MKKLSSLFVGKNPYLWALVSSLIIISLVAAFTIIPQDEWNQLQDENLANAAVSDLPSYCSFPSSVNAINKYGRETEIANNTVIYRVAGDMLNLSVGNVPENSEVIHTIYVLTPDKSQVIYPYGNFSSEGTFSFYAKKGVYAVGTTLTPDQFEACGGSSTFKNVIEYQDTFFVSEYYLKINLLQPTPQPRHYSTPAPAPAA
ncbi:MAG: hypothetical protein JEZ00_20975 [Anaerolineaceae bacterium]|nr:hypothetical protein [Anaerolineaceae bacterium]